MLMFIGILVALGAAVTFLVVGALSLFGGARATTGQVVPGFKPDQPSVLVRGLALLSLWGPIALIALLCLLVGIKLFQVAVAAF